MNQVLALELMMQHCNIEADNDIDSLDQENEVNGPDNAVQTNDFSVIQSSDRRKYCNEFEAGTNTVTCEMVGMDNEIEAVDPIQQSNDAVGSAGATISQNNEIDGDDALGIPGITQVIVGDNTCGQTGSGDNEASVLL